MKMSVFTRALILILVSLCFRHHVLCDRMSDILEASADFLEKAFSEEVDFESPDAFSEEWMEKAERVMKKYVKKIKEVHKLDQHTMGKRGTDEQLSITRDYQGVNALTRIEELYDTSAQYPHDITLFYLLNDKGARELCAATLQSFEEDPEQGKANVMVVFKLEGDRFKLLDKASVMGGVDIESFHIKGVPHIVCAEYDAGSSGRPLEGSVLYRLVDKKLQNVQTLNTKYPSDISIWEDLNEIYMAVAISQVNQSNQIGYEADSIVFRWLGEHFDLITTIKTYNARCVTPFKIGSTMYLAVANHMNNQDETDIDSEIFKYNLNEDRFVSHQKIRTHGAMDIKFFSSANKRKREHFIVVANSFEMGLDGNKIYETGSIIYKYADDYFVPFQSIRLNAATQWLHISGPRGELVLIAACSSGVKTFQYDGWRFVETEVLYSTSSLGPGISSMRSFTFGGGPILAVANKNKHMGDADIFNLKFKPKYDLKEFHADLHNWCEAMTDKVETDDLDGLLQKIESLPKEDDEIVYLVGDLVIEDGRIHTLEADTIKIGDSIVMDEDLILELNNYTDTLNHLENELEAVNSTIKNSMKKSGVNHINGSLKFEDLSMTCLNCEFEDAHISMLNDENVDRFLHNVVYLSDGLVANESMTFEEVTVESFQDGPQYFNGKPITALVGRSKDSHIMGTLQLEGTATLLDGLSVYGVVDGLPFSTRTVLLNDGDQSLDGSISILSASVNNLEAATINNMNSSQFLGGTIKVGGYHNIHTPTVLKDVKVSSMKIHGNYHGVDFESIVNSTLKTCGVQTLNGQWSFEKLRCGNFSLGQISGYNLEDFVKISGYEYSIDGELDFREALTVKNLNVVNDFNGIAVLDGMLDVLMMNHEETNFITGKKEFESLFVKSELTVSESFNDLNIEEWNSVRTIYDPVELNGDVKIHGKFSINGNMKAGDVRDNTGNYSLKKVLQHGIKLSDSTVGGKSLTLHGEIKVDTVQVESINGVSTESWVVQNGKQTISALKIFNEGMQVLQPIELTGLINGVDLVELNGDVLKTYGDQTIEGLKLFKDLKAPRFTAGECLFGDKWCDDLLFTNEVQSINGTTMIHGSVKVLNDLSVVNLTVGGYVAGYDLDFLIEDTLFDNGKNTEIKAEKVFKGPLTIDNLEVSGNVGVLDIRNLLHLLYVKQFTSAEGSIIVSQPTSIKNVIVTGWLNGIPDEEIGISWLLHSGDQTIKGDQVFGSVIAKQNVVLLLGEVNGLNLQEMVENAAMVNENCSLGSVNFGKVTAETLQLAGLIQGLNFPEDIVFGDAEEIIEISAKKVFKSKLVVEGNMKVEKIGDQINFEKMCELFINDEPSGVALTVEGNVELDVEPHVLSLNGIDIEAISSEVWMADQDAVLSGYKDFSEMIFNGTVEVEGLVDGIDIKSLPQRYLSKTKDQVINGMADFPGHVVFEKTLTASKAYVEGLTSEIDLEDFITDVLLSGPDQTFTVAPKFEEITIEGDLDARSINGMVLKQDVMLWDRDLNAIKGKLKVKSVFVNELKLGEDAKVQGINIPLWRELAVIDYGGGDNSIQVIKGTKTLVNAEFRSNLWVEGKLNNLQFDGDHIMLLSEEQTVTGKKTFVKKQSHDKPLLHADMIDINGNFNGVNIQDFLSRLAHRNEDIIFTAPKTFTSPMSAENVDIKGLYHGVNISMISPDQVPDTYSKILSKYDGLYSATGILQESLERRAIYVSHYHLVQDMKGGLILPLSFDNNEPLVAVINKRNDSNTVMDIYNWDSKAGLFTRGGMERISDNLTYVTSMECTQAYFVYIEFYNEGELSMHKENANDKDITVGGYFLKHTTKHGFTKSNNIETMGTSSAVPVLVPLQRSCCFFLAQWYGQFSPVLCQRGSFDQMVVFQRIPANKITEASSGFINNSPYIAYITDTDDIPEKGGSILHVWMYANQTKLFELQQEILIEGAQSVASIEYREFSYLAVTSGGMPHAVSPGMIKIYRFHPELGTFVNWVNLDVTLPWSVKFSLLSSDELVLYVSTKNPSKPFIVYLYNGVAGFKELTFATHAPTLAQITTLNAGTWNNLVALSGVGGTKLFQPAFKGI